MKPPLPVPSRVQLLALLRLTIADMEAAWAELGQLEATGQTWREYGESRQQEAPRGL